MLGSEHTECHAEDGVGTGGEDLEALVHLVDGDPKAGPFGAADPVALHGPHPVRPIVERVEVVEKPVGVLGDLEEPLRETSLLHHCPAPLTRAIDHLFVGEHGLVPGAPVDRGGGLVRQPAVEQLQEEPLVPAVEGRVMTGQLPAPVEGGAELAEVHLHPCYLVLDTGAGRDPGLDGPILGRKAEAVPPHRAEHVVALHHLVPRHQVDVRVVADVTDMQLPRRIGVHGHVVELGHGGVLGDPEDRLGLPTALPFGLYRLVVVRHECHQGRSVLTSPESRAGCTETRHASTSR